jgi:Fe-Mn family superoxide dismutase
MATVTILTPAVTIWLSRHHRAYVEGANKAIERLKEARKQQNFDNIAALEKSLAFNISGHVLHSIFWQNLSPDGGGGPDGELAAAIERDFGGFEPFKAQMIHAASTIMGRAGQHWFGIR